MKKIALILLLLPTLLASQTSLDEYRYLTKGYAYQIEMGLDPVKKGYEIRENFRADNGVLIMGMYKINQSTPQGLLFIVPKSTTKSAYFAIPHPDSAEEVQLAYQQDRKLYKSTEVSDQLNLAKDQYLFFQNKNIIPQEYAAVPKNGQSIDNKPITTEFTSKGNGFSSNPSPMKDPVLTNKSAGKLVFGDISGDLAARGVIAPPKTQYSGRKSGKVMVKFCVNKNGAVTFAKFTQRGSTTLDTQLKQLAVDAIKKTQFAQSSSTKDCGTAAFVF